MENPPTSSNAQDNPQQPATPKPKRAHIKLRKLFLGAFIIVLFLVAAVYVSAFWHEPDPSVDYLAKLNAKALAVPEEDRAWPLYRELLIKYDLDNMYHMPGDGPVRNPNYKPPATTQPAVPETEQPSVDPQSFDDIWGNSETADTSSEFLSTEDRIPASDTRWPGAKAELDKYADLFESIRQATHKKSLGVVIRRSYQGHDDYLARQYASAEQPQLLVSMSLVFVSKARKFGHLLSADFDYAIQQKDWPRAMANLQALVALAGHASEQGALIHQLVGISIISMAHDNLQTVLEDHASLIPLDVLDQFSMFLEQSSPDFDFDTTAERWMSRDYLQNLYGANGRITYKGILKAMEWRDPPPQVLSLGVQKREDTTIVLRLILPWVIVTTGSHQQLLHEMDVYDKVD